MAAGRVSAHKQLAGTLPRDEPPVRLEVRLVAEERGLPVCRCSFEGVPITGLSIAVYRALGRLQDVPGRRGGAGDDLPELVCRASDLLRKRAFDAGLLTS